MIFFERINKQLNSLTVLEIKNRVSLFISILLLIAFFLSYLIPEWYTASFNQINFFVNAWDEANYLTNQMATMSQFSPGYWLGENIYLLLEQLGISGSWQNVLFDTIFVPAIFFLVLLIIKDVFNIKGSQAILLALTICFSSVLFSYMNNLIGSYFGGKFPNQDSFLVASEFSFPAILRTPNPQLSYLIIAVFIFLYVRFKKIIYLLAPLLFVYFAVFIFYLYLLSAWICFLKAEKMTFINRTITANLFGIFIVLISMLFLTSSESIKELLIFSNITNAQAYIIAASHQFQLPLVFVTFLISIPIVLFKYKNNPSVLFFYLTCLCSLLVCSNTHVVTGLMFAPKVLQSSSAAVIAAILLALLLFSSEEDKVDRKTASFFQVMLDVLIFGLIFSLLVKEIVGYGIFGAYVETIKTAFNTIKPILFVFIGIGYFIFCYNKISGVLRGVIPLVVLCLILRGQSFSFDGFYYTVPKYPTFPQETIDKIKENSPFVLFVGNDAKFYAQHFPYAIPKLYSSLQSYHYEYLPFIKSCKYNVQYMLNAIQWAKMMPESELWNNLIQELTSRVTVNRLIIESMPINFVTDPAYCRKNPDKSNFYLVHIKEPIRLEKFAIF